MRIALFSDVHANLPAFEALLASLDEQKPAVVYCLGDLIGYNIWPNEIIAEIRKRGIATLKGNHDEKTKGYAYEQVTADNRAYLDTLPAHIRLEYADFQILLVHGSPRKIDEYVLEEMPEYEVIQMMDAAKADILCVAHSHLPYHRNFSDKQVINTGSVGKPKDGDPRGGYVILNVGTDITVDFIRFNYDIEKAANAIIDSPLPDELAERIIKAY